MRNTHYKKCSCQFIFCLLFSKQEIMLFKLELERFYRESDNASMWPSFRALRPLRERKKQDMVTLAALTNIDLGIFLTFYNQLFKLIIDIINKKEI